MAEYFPGRRQAGEKTEVSLDSGKSKVQCTVFERWVDISPGTDLYCGAKSTVELTKAVGITQTSSETLEGSVESSLGVAGVAKIKSQIKGVLGKETNWNESVTHKVTFECEAPKCGHYQMTIHQLQREYELTLFRRGMWPFRSDSWDWKWDKTIVEKVDQYDAIPDVTEFDERCKCPPKDSPDYDGRLGCEIGNLGLRVPFKLNPSGFQVQIGKYVVSFTFMNYSAGMRALNEKFDLLLPKEALYGPLSFLAGIQEGRAAGSGNHVKAVAHRYVDPRLDTGGTISDVVSDPVVTAPHRQTAHELEQAASL